MIKACFVCTTPYQIIAAVTIAATQDSISDLFIVPQFRDVEIYYKKIKSLDIFSEVILVDASKIEAYKNRKNRIAFGLGIVENYAKLSSVVCGITGEKNYQRIFISSQANIGRLIGIYYQRQGAEIIFFDDGEGSYDDYKIYEAQGVDRLIRKLMFGKKSIWFSKNRQLYCPELYEKIFGISDNVKKIFNWSSDQDLLGKINYICGWTENAKITHKYILLDTIPNESFNAEGAELYEKLVDICVKSFSDNLIIKRHPRDRRNLAINCDIYQFPSLPFEVICANSDVENKVLVCAESSAAFMPKLLFDAEPTVILLYRITGVRVGDENKREIMVSYVKDLYRDKDRFIVPETVAEFIEAIRKLTN